MLHIRRSNGFTITEVIASMAILSFGTIAIVGLATSIQSAQRSNQYLNTANIAARNILENMRNNQSSALVYGQTIQKTSSDEPTLAQLPSGKADVTTSYTPDTYGVKNVSITVTYKIGQDVRSVYLSSYVGPQGILQ